MTGEENIKVGDKLICVQNEGLMCAGWSHIVKGISETSINVIGAATSWQSRKEFRWHCYRWEPLKHPIQS